MNLNWNEYIPGIKIRRWDKTACEYKYSIDIDLQEDELGIITSVVGQPRSNRQIYDLPDDCTKLLANMKRTSIETVVPADIRDCLSGDTHYVYSYHNVNGNRIDGNVNDSSAATDILKWIKAEYSKIPEIADF